MQTKTESIIETLANIATGMLISYLLGMIVYPLYGFNVTPGQNTEIVIIYTAVSMTRSYAWRRIFNYRTIRKYK